MTARELINLLGDADPDAEIRIAYHPAWPLRAEIAAVALDGEIFDGIDVAQFVWIAVTNGVDIDEYPYAPREAWEI